ncbi:MAG: hypothetical protein HKN45_10355 [Flavobacteriales bacterium]|nr:hypothetical protein [Flavobacteriales bacterium]
MHSVFIQSILLLFVVSSCSVDKKFKGDEPPASLACEPAIDNPFGSPHPDAPEEIKDWHELIGECHCRSVKRLDKDNWADTTDLVWKWKYIMNGTAVQDETFNSDSSYAGSIRQYIPDSARWYVHYYSNPGQTPKIPTWEGNRIGDEIILYNDQKAPNGMDGKFKITFSNIREDGFDWRGEWVTPDESFIYPTWHIMCKKRAVL